MMATTKQKEQKAQEQGTPLEFIGKGAMCTCTGAQAPNPVPLQVTSQQKLYCNGGKLQVATNRDSMPPNLNFGSCKIKNPSMPQPCTAQIQWQNTYPNSQLNGTQQVLTLKSIGQCSFGGMIAVKTSGQQSSPQPPAAGSNSSHVENQTNPLLSPPKHKDKPNPTTKKDQNIHPLTAKDNPHIDGRTTHSVYKPLNTPCLFQFGEGTEDHIDWEVSLSDSTKTKNVTIDIQKPGSISKCTFKKEGTYTLIATQRNGSHQSKGIINIKVIKDPIILTLTPGTTNKFEPGQKITVKAEGHFLKGNSSIPHLQYQLYSHENEGKELSQNDENGKTNYTIKPDANSPKDTITLTIFKEGTYTIHAQSTELRQMVYCQNLSIETLKVTGLTANGHKTLVQRQGLPVHLQVETNLFGKHTPGTNDPLHVTYQYSFKSVAAEEYQSIEQPDYHRPGYYQITANTNKQKQPGATCTVHIQNPKCIEAWWEDKAENRRRFIGFKQKLYACFKYEGLKGAEGIPDVALDFSLNIPKIIPNPIALTEVEKIENTENQNNTIYKVAVNLDQINSNKLLKNIANQQQVSVQFASHDHTIQVDSDIPSSNSTVTYEDKTRINGINCYCDQEANKRILQNTRLMPGYTYTFEVLTQNMRNSSSKLCFVLVKDQDQNQIITKVEEQPNEDGILVIAKVTLPKAESKSAAVSPTPTTDKQTEQKEQKPTYHAIATIIPGKPGILDNLEQSIKEAKYSLAPGLVFGYWFYHEVVEDPATSSDSKSITYGVAVKPPLYEIPNRDTKYDHERGIVMVLEGVGIHNLNLGQQQPALGDASYPLFVYHDITLTEFKDLYNSDDDVKYDEIKNRKDLKQILTDGTIVKTITKDNSKPIQVSASVLSRDALDFNALSDRHSTIRYHHNTECPPGIFLVHHTPNAPNTLKPHFIMHLSDPGNKDHTIHYKGIARRGICIHQWDASGSAGCLTLQRGSLPKVATDFVTNYLHDFKHSKKDKKSVLVWLVVKERTDTRTIYFQPIIDIKDGKKEYRIYDKDGPLQNPSQQDLLEIPKDGFPLQVSKQTPLDWIKEKLHQLKHNGTKKRIPYFILEGDNDKEFYVACHRTPSEQQHVDTSEPTDH